MQEIPYKPSIQGQFHEYDIGQESLIGKKMKCRTSIGRPEKYLQYIEVCTLDRMWTGCIGKVQMEGGD